MKRNIAKKGRGGSLRASGQLERKEHALENHVPAGSGTERLGTHGNGDLSASARITHARLGSAYTGERQRQGDWQKVDVIHPVTPHTHSSPVTGGHVSWFRPSRQQSTRQPLAHSCPPAGWGGENTTKSSWVETRTGGDHSPIMVTGKTDSFLGKNKPISFVNNQIRVG